MTTSTVENYLKEIYQEQALKLGSLVPLGKVAAILGVVPGTVTTMVKSLSDEGLVVYEPRQGVKLTPRGERIALSVLRRHRLVEMFLVEILKLDWSEVHEEAEELEHVISEKVLDRIDDLLGHPEFDPHGDPIPSKAGKLTHRKVVLLSECESGADVRVARIVDQDPKFLQYATQHGLTPGACFTIGSHDPFGDLWLLIAKRRRVKLQLGGSAASRILVEQL